MDIPKHSSDVLMFVIINKLVRDMKTPYTYWDQSEMHWFPHKEPDVGSFDDVFVVGLK